MFAHQEVEGTFSSFEVYEISTKRPALNKCPVLFFQILLFIPVLWITIALFMYSERGGGSGGSGSGSGPGGGSADGGAAVRSRGARRDLSENVNRDAAPCRKAWNFYFPFQVATKVGCRFKIRHLVSDSVRLGSPPTFQ